MRHIYWLWGPGSCLVMYLSARCYRLFWYFSQILKPSKPQAARAAAFVASQKRPESSAKSLQVVIMLYHINLSNVIQFRSSWDPPICSARSEGPSSKQWAHPSGQQKALCQLVRFVRKWEPARLLIEREVRSQRFGGDTTPTIQPFVLLNPQRSTNPIFHRDVPQYTGANHGTGPSL